MILLLHPKGVTFITTLFSAYFLISEVMELLPIFIILILFQAFATFPWFYCACVETFSSSLHFFLVSVSALGFVFIVLYFFL